MFPQGSNVKGLQEDSVTCMGTFMNFPKGNNPPFKQNKTKPGNYYYPKKTRKKADNGESVPSQEDSNQHD